MSRMKTKWSMLNGNRLDETLRTMCYSSQMLLSFRRLTMTMTMVPSCIDLWFSICHANHTAFVMLTIPLFGHAELVSASVI